MLNFPISVRLFSSGSTPASESLLALTSTMTRIAFSFLFWVLPKRRARGGEIDDREGHGYGLPARDGPQDEEGLRPLDRGGGQRRVRRLVGQISLAGKEPQERAALERDMIANRAAQHRVPGLERVEDGRARDRAGADVELHLVANVRQGAQVRREDDADHRRVWTSTDSTAGRSRTTGVQLSPASADMYTCPPDVPKYTPHLSSESTAIASRSTFT